MSFLESWVPKMCSLMTILKFATSFKVSRKFPGSLNWNLSYDLEKEDFVY